MQQTEEFIEFKETVKEPGHEVIEKGDPNELAIDILAVADEGRYECNITEIKFEDTNMLQSSTFTFDLSNVSSVSLEYFWNITTFNNNDQVKAAFTIDPSIGTIPPKTVQTFTVKFDPKTPGQYQCELESTISPLNEEQAASPLILPIICKATRPICHFDFGAFEYAEYIALGIRKPSIMGPNGKIGESLPPNIRVLQNISHWEFGSHQLWDQTAKSVNHYLRIFVFYRIYRIGNSEAINYGTKRQNR